MQQYIPLEKTTRYRSNPLVIRSNSSQPGNTDPREPLLRAIARKIVADFLQEAVEADTAESNAKSSKKRPNHSIEAKE